MHARMFLASLASLSLAAVVIAEPRDSGTFTNVISDQPGGAGTVAFLQTNSYTTRFVHVTGTLNSVASGTYGREATIRMIPGVSLTRPAFCIAPSQSQTFTTENVDAFVRLARPASVFAGTQWSLETFETIDDGAGADAVWANLTVTLNDGPPTAATGLVANLGSISGYQSYVVPVSAGQAKWIKFELLADANSSIFTYLDIDTEGTQVGNGGGIANDTEIALFNEDGFSVGRDDDDGSGALSQLTYGAGTRPAAGNSQPYNGRDGNLPPGIYDLRVGGYNPTLTEQVGWDFPNPGSVQSGSIRVNIRTNAGQPAFCPPDFNKSGTLEAQDIFDFLGAWFGGC